MSDGNLERITILLQARDRDFARAMDRNNKLIARLNRDGSRNMDRMSRTVNSRLDTMAAQATAFGRTFALGVGGALVTGAIGVMTTGLARTVRGIAAVADEAKRSGMGLDSFQEWSFVAEQNRIGVDQLVDGFKELNLRADEFITTGGGSAAESFARLGYDADALARKLEDPSELMLDIIDRLGDMDRAAQIRISDEIFGGSAGERFVELLDQGQHGLRNTINRAHELGAVLDEQVINRAVEIDRRFGEISTTVSGWLQNSVVGWAALISELTSFREIADEIEGLRNQGQAAGILGVQSAGELGIDPAASAENAETVRDIVAEYERLSGAAMELMPAIRRLSDELHRAENVDAAQSVSDLAFGIERLSDGIDSGEVSAGQFESQMEDLIESASTTLRGVEDLDSPTFDRVMDRLSGLGAMLDNLVGRAQALRRSLPGAEDGGYGMTEGTPLTGLPMPPMPYAPGTSPRPRLRPVDFLPGDGVASTGGNTAAGGSAEGYAASIEEIRSKTRALELEAAALIAVAASGREYGDAIEFARTKAQLMTSALEDGREVTPELEAQIDALAEAYVTAGQNAEDAAAKMEKVRENSQRGVDAITDLFMSVTQGGDAARAAVARLLIELARVQVQRALLGAAGSRGGGFFSVLGGLLSGGRSAGGGVRAGEAYRINENTPNTEIMVPSRSGGVLNVAQAKDALRGQAGGGVERVDVFIHPSGEFDARVEGASVRVFSQGIQEFARKGMSPAVQKSMADPRARNR